MSKDMGASSADAEDRAATASQPSREGVSGIAGIPSAKRPWQPHERNYSGGRFGVWHNGEWTMLRVEAGVADATASIRS